MINIYFFITKIYKIFDFIIILFNIVINLRVISKEKIRVLWVLNSNNILSF